MGCDCFDFKTDYMLLKEYKYWKLFIAESQLLIGWSHAVLKRHAEFFEEMSEEELLELKQVIIDWKKMLNNTFKPEWFNIMQLGNMTKHLHFQLVPRYKGERFFDGRTFIDETWGKMVPHKWVVEGEDFLTKLRNHLTENLNPASP